MTSYQLTRRQALKAVTGAIATPYAATLHGSPALPDLAGEVPIDPEQFGASTAAADNHAAITMADAFANRSGAELKFGPGVYNVLADLEMTTTWRLDEGTILRFAGPQIPGGRRLVRIRSYGGATHRTARLGQPAKYPRAALKNSDAPTRIVTVKKPSEARLFSVGSIVRISFGYDPYDADGQLYRFDRLNRVIGSDSSTGRIELETAIPTPIQGWGFEPDGPFYNPVDWANRARVSAGECRYHRHLASGQAGNPNIGGVFRALTGGITNGKSPLDDSGVEWERVTNDYNGPDNNFYSPPYGRGTAFIDGSPVIELVEMAAVGIGLYGGTILWAGPYAATMGVDIRSAYKCLCEGVTVASESHHIGNRWSVTEAASECALNGNMDRSSRARQPAGQDRTIMSYGADLLVKNHDCGQAWSNPSTPLVFVESFAVLKVEEGCRFINQNPVANTFGFIAGGGAEVSITRATIRGFTVPLRQQAPFTSAVDRQWFHAGRYIDVQGSDIQISEKQVRFGRNDDSPRDLYIGNRLILFDAGPGHGNAREFLPSAIQPIEFEFTPAPDKKDAIVPVPQPQGKTSLIFLQAAAWWDDAPEGGRITIYPRRSTGNLGVLLASVNLASAGITLTASMPRGTISGDGTSSLLADYSRDEHLQISYTSNRQAAFGKVRITILALCE